MRDYATALSDIIMYNYVIARAGVIFGIYFMSCRFGAVK